MSERLFWEVGVARSVQTKSSLNAIEGLFDWLMNLILKVVRNLRVRR